MPTLPLTGGCQCGAVRYEIRQRPLTLYLCHCTECQKQSSSAFGMSLTVPRNSLAIVRGKLQRWTRDSDSGRAVDCLFCGACGTRVIHERPAATEVLNVKAGTLDDTRWLWPVGHLWTDSAQPWLRPLIDGMDDTLRYSAQPADKKALEDRWIRLWQAPEGRS